MSRAFVKEDAGDDLPPERFGLPPVDDPAFPTAAALVLIEAARDGNLASAEAATGYRFGDAALFGPVRRMLAKEEARPALEQDVRFIRAARRYLAER